MNIKGRDLSTGDPRTVIKYQQLLLNEINNSDIEKRIDEINRTLETQEADEAIKQKFEEIDDEITDMKLRCEKMSKQRYKHPWSPILKKAYRNFQFWNIWLSEKRLSKRKRKRLQIASNMETRKVNLLQQRLKYADDDNKQFAYICDNKTINENVKKAKNQLNEIKSKASQHRIEFLKLQAETYNDQGCKDMEKAVKALMSREKRRRIFRKLRGVMGKIKSGGLDHVLKTDREGKEERISDKEQMYEEIIKRNIKHFSQADGTPFTTEPLRSLVEATATNDFCDQILNGTIDLEGLDIEDATKALLKNLVKNDDYELIDQHISEDDLIAGYKKWNENTSTSPSGCHLGHEKAILKRIREQDIEGEISETAPLYKRIFRITAQKLNWAIQHGYVYERWKKVVNAMIEKIPGKPLLNKLRIIHLLESDFNLMIGILWGRRLVYLAEDKKLYDDGQSGSRPGKRCQELLLQKDSTLAIWRMSRTDGIFFDNDAKSCFDRIVMTCASLCSQHFGMPKQPCELFLKTLNDMKYHIKTSFGISETYYSSTDSTSVHGPGQGGRGSPSIWLAISSLIMKCARQRSDGATMINPFNNSERVNLNITGFVDDVTHWISNGSRDIIEQISDIQVMAQWWEQLLYSTGGKLELEKCFLYVLRWQFDNEGNLYIVKPENLPVNVKITDSETKKEYTINYRNCNDHHKSLGVMGIPSGSNKAEYERLMKKSHSFAQRIGVSNINRNETKTLYFSCYIPGMLYSMCVGSLSFSQCQKVQGATTQTFLSRMGYNRCLPSAVVYANPKIGGIGLRNLFAEQGTEKICHILQTIRCGTTTGSLLKIRLLWAQLLSGIQKPIFEDVTTYLPHLDTVDPWIKTMREFLFESELTIKFPELKEQRLKCVNDQFIMMIAIENMTKDEIIKVNNCRLYLRATTISDIVSADGKTIPVDTYWCNECAIVKGRDTWPIQDKPGKKTIAIWQKMLDVITEVESHKLETPLGPWKKYRSDIINTNLSTFYETNTKQVMKYDKLSRSWKKGIGRTGRLGFKLQGWIPTNTEPIMNNLIPASTETSANYELLKWRKVEIIPETYHTVRTWRQLIESKEGWEQKLLSDINFSFVNTISSMTKRSNNIQVFINNSVKDHVYSYSWIAFNGITKTGNASGFPTGTNSSLHRTEIYAIFSWISMTRYLIQMNQTMKFKFNSIIYVTSRTIVKELHPTFVINCMKHSLIDDYDLVNEVKTVMEDMQNRGCNIEVRIVKHKRKKKKDDITPIEERSLQAKDMAKTTIQQSDQLEDMNIVLPSCQAYLVSGGKILTGEEKTTARWKWSDFMIQDYYCDKLGLTLDELHTIDWFTLKRSREKMSPSLQTFSIKYVINWLPTGSRLEIQGELVTGCIHCGLLEDSTHLLQCLKRKEKIPSMIARFAKEMDDCKTDPRLKRTLLHHIAMYFHENKLVPRSHIQDHQSAVKEQETIGWDNFTKGLWSKKWKMIQDEYEERHGIKKNNWATKIMTWWIQTGHDAWMDRNEKIHSSETTASEREQEEAIENVRFLYSLENEVTMDDRDIFEMSLARRITYPAKSLMIWVRNMKEKIMNSIQQQQINITRGQQSILNWLTSGPTEQDETNNEVNETRETNICETINNEDTNSTVRNKSPCPGPILAED